MPLTPGRALSQSAARWLQTAGKQSLFLDSRRRRHLAVLATIFAVTAFGYGLLQPRHVRVLADGEQVVIETHINSDAALLGRAGVDLAPGDRVTALESDGADVLQVERARRVALHVDGVTYTMLTHAETIDQLLDEADVVVEQRDSIVQNGLLVSTTAPVDPPSLFATSEAIGRTALDALVAIEVRRAVPFIIVDDGVEMETSSSRPSVALALREAGISVGPGDLVEPPPDASLLADARIEVRRARAVTVALPEGHTVLYTLARTVGDVLAEAGIVLPQGAFVEPSPESDVFDGMSVRVVQLSATSDIEREFIESKTLYESDASLPPGQIRTVKGHDGVLVRRYEITYVNGEEAGRELVDEYYDPEPVDTVVYYPTRTGRNESAPSDVGTISKTLHVYATYYTPASSGREPSDPAYGITATGAVVTYGIVAVDPNIIPLGTKMFIPGYGHAIAADTGGAVKGYIVDLGFPDGVPIDWTPKWLDIYILE